MPRKPINYANCIIYHFICKDASIVDTYVGHTTNFVERKGAHKTICSSEMNKLHQLKIYQNIRANGGWTNWEMMPLEEFPCENKTQARIREQYWIDKLQAQMNTNRAFQTEEQKKEQIQEYIKLYRNEHQTEIKKYDKQYYDEHRDKKQIYARQKITCACGIIHTQSNKTIHLRSEKHMEYISLS